MCNQLGDTACHESTLHVIKATLHVQERREIKAALHDGDVKSYLLYAGKEGDRGCIA